MDPEAAAGTPSDKRPRARPRAPSPPLSHVDRLLLAFLGDHRVILLSQVSSYLEVTSSTARRRLGRLGRGGYLAQAAAFTHRDPGYLITARGMRAIGSPGRAPKVRVGEYLHDVGLGWVWLEARRGTFGPLREVISERQMRSARGPSGGPGAAPLLQEETDHRLGVRLWDVGPQGRDRVHLPDLVLRTQTGKTVAVELELTGKSRRQRERIMSAYAAARWIDGVLYLADRPTIARGIRAAAVRAGAESKVHVQTFRWSPSMRDLAELLRGERMLCGRTRDRSTVPARAREGLGLTS